MPTSEFTAIWLNLGSLYIYQISDNALYLVLIFQGSLLAVGQDRIRLAFVKKRQLKISKGSHGEPRLLVRLLCYAASK